MVQKLVNSQKIEIPKNCFIDSKEVEKRNKKIFRSGLFEYEGQWKKKSDGC